VGQFDVEAALQAAEKLVWRVIPRSRRRRGISHWPENTQSEIPRSARNDSLEGFFRSLFIRQGMHHLVRRLTDKLAATFQGILE
jgi:hypothetical protein